MRDVPADMDLHVGDLRPPVHATLTDADGTVIDLTAATGATFRLVSLADGTVKVDDVAANIVDAAGGVLEYRWAVGDTDTAGDYRGTFTVTWDDTKPETFPNRAHHLIRIHE